MSQALTVTGGFVLDPRGRFSQADLLLRDDKIAVVERPGGLKAAQGVPNVDATGCTITPGLVDGHIHLSIAGEGDMPSSLPEITVRAAQNLMPVLASGVTFACDLGGYDGVSIALSRAIARGDLIGPEVIAANRILCSTGGHTSNFAGVGLECDGVDGVRQAVREQVKRGAGLVKVALNGGRNRVEFSQAELRALVDEAHRLGVRVAAHASIRESVALAVQAGVDSVQHGNGADPETLDKMAASDVVLVPTCWAFRTGLAHALEDCQRDPQNRDLASTARSWQLRVDQQHELLTDARARGVRIGAGTDALIGQPAASIFSELRAMTELGLSEEEALTAATAGGAAAVGLGDRGALRPGAVADLVVFPARSGHVLDPGVLPRLVIQAGRIVVDRRSES